MYAHEWTEYDPLADDMAPSRAEARRDEAAIRRRRGRPVVREAHDGPASLLEALERSVAAAQAEYRKARR